MRIQAAKESLYATLRDRLQVINPGRIAKLGGTTRIAIAMETMCTSEAEKSVPGVFYLGFSGVETVPETGASGGVLLRLHCAVHYSDESERTISEMDEELMKATMPTSTALMDWSTAPPVRMGDRIFWTMPKITGAGQRTAEMALFVRI
jgi:hypothetical protein